MTEAAQVSTEELAAQVGGSKLYNHDLAPVPEGQKSLAYAFTYRGTDKTLTDADVNASHTKVVESFKVQLKATLRE